jgi:hypothetical protein
MHRTITVRRGLPAAVDAVTALSADPGGWLPAPAIRQETRRWEVALAAGVVTATVLCTVGPPLVTRDGVRRLLRWEPQDRGAPWGTARNLPELEGFLEVTAGEDGMVITLDGTYRPPLGIVGAVFDRFGMSRLAVRTAEDFLDEVVRRLTAGAAV